MLIDDSNFTDKASRDPEQRKIYEESDDYIDAYSKHTDWRIKNHGPARAIGGDWETHGQLQLKFLRDQGLQSNHRLLDFGCGTGRFARIVVPFLDTGNYTGLDISKGAIEHCMLLGTNEGWLTKKKPIFIHSTGSLESLLFKQFDFIWMHSVFTHLPPDIIQNILDIFSKMDFGKFLFTYKRRPKPLRTGLKQFGYPPEWFEAEADKVGLKATDLADRFPQGQSSMMVERKK